MKLMLVAFLAYCVGLSALINVGVEASEQLSYQQLKRRIKRTTSKEPICGLPGRNGRDGRDGLQGPFGPPGPTGSPGQPCTCPTITDGAMIKTFDSLFDKKIVTTIDDLWFKHNKPMMEKLDLILEQKSHGSGFPPSVTDSKGFMAGSHYTNKGSGTNHLCLPSEPQWNNTVAGHQSKSYIYGTEFEISAGNSGFLQTNSHEASQHDHEVQCAVCHTSSRPSHVMIPARLECPSGWTMEYLGFLMAAHHAHRATEYVCVDQNPDAHPATAANLDGHLIYTVEAVCGALPCPNYVEGFELTCIVCTK